MEHFKFNKHIRLITSRSKHIYKIMRISLIPDETCAGCHIILRVQDIKDRQMIKFIGHSDLSEKWPLLTIRPRDGNTPTQNCPATMYSRTEKERDGAGKPPYILSLGMGMMTNGSNSFTFRPLRARCPADSNPEGQHDSLQRHGGGEGVKQKYSVIPRLTKIIRSGITFVSRNLR